MRASRKILPVLAVVLVVAGCGVGAGPGEEKLYVFLPRSLDSRFWVDAGGGLEAEAEELGVRAEFLGPAEEDVGEQVELFEEAIAREPAGIAVAADDTEEIRASIARAREAGIPVISWVTPLPDSEVMAHAGADDFAAGEEAAGALAETLGGEGQVALLTTSLDAPGVGERVDGFERGLEDHPGVEVVYVGITGEDVGDLPGKVGFLLQTRPELDALFGVTGPEVPGAAEAVRDFDDCGEVRVAGFEPTPATIELMEDGCVQLLVARKPYETTAAALRLLDGIEGGEEPEDVLTGVIPVFEGDLDRFLESAPH